MSSTYTTNLHLELQGTGDNSGTWGGVLNSNVFQIIDDAIGNVQTISLSGTDVTLTTSQTQKNAFILTGALIANVSVIWPSINRTAFVINNTTGAYTVTLKAGTPSATVVIQQGARRFVVVATNNVYAQTQADIGDMKEIGGSSPQAGWLLCYGQAISRTTYSALFNEIGTAYGIGDGSTTFNLPDRRGRVAAGRDDMGGSSAGRLTSTTMSPDGTTLGATGGEQTHTLVTSEMPSHRHGLPQTLNATTFPPVAGSGVAGFATTSTTESAGGDGAHNNTQPTIIHNVVIYTGVV